MFEQFPVNRQKLSKLLAKNNERLKEIGKGITEISARASQQRKFKKQREVLLIVFGFIIGWLVELVCFIVFTTGYVMGGFC